MLIEAGGVQMPGNPVKISGYDDPPVRAGAPALDQHGAAVRKEFAKAMPANDPHPGAAPKTRRTLYECHAARRPGTLSIRAP